MNIFNLISAGTRFPVNLSWSGPLRIGALVVMILWLWHPAVGQTVHPGHSHNDYEHPRPLFGAIEHGFHSLEIDIWLKNDQLIVSHIPVFLGLKPTLQKRYLDPLKEWIEKNQGFVFPGDSTPLVLYLDFKTGGGTYEKVREVLESYRKFLTLWYPDSVRWGPVSILIDHHREDILADTPRWAQVQKGWDQYAIDLPPEVCPRLNGSYRSLFKWRGRGEMPPEAFDRLKTIFENAHAHGRTVRLYAATNKRKVWRTLLDAGADWINVDRCQRFETFYREYEKGKE